MQYIMRLSLVGALAAIVTASPTLAAATIFFGEDNTSGVTPVNSIATRDAFFGALNSVATENFDGFAPGDSQPLMLHFGTIATATAYNNVGFIASGNVTDVSSDPVSGTNFFSRGQVSRLR